MMIGYIYGLFALATEATKASTAKALVVAMLAVFSVHRDDKGPEHLEAKAYQEDLVAESIATEIQAPDLPTSPRVWAAVLLAVAENETHLSLQVHQGNCKRYECDALRQRDGSVIHRARSPWQMHRNKHNAAVWDDLVGIENTPVQVRAASDMLKRAYWTCYKYTSDPIAGTFLAFSGRGCVNTKWDGLAARMRSFKKFSHAQVQE